MTSLVAKKDIPLATRIEEAMKKNESLEALSANSVRRDAFISKQIDQKYKAKVILTKSSSKVGKKAPSAQKSAAASKGKASASTKSKTTVAISKPIKSPGGGKRVPTRGNKLQQSRKSGITRIPTSKLSVVGFRGRSSAGRRQSSKST